MLIVLFIYGVAFIGVIIGCIFYYIRKRKKKTSDVLTLETGSLVHPYSSLQEAMTVGGIDPAPNSYLGIEDGGREIYLRSITLSAIPRKVRYAETFTELFDFPQCESHVFIKPVDSETMGRKIDKHINILETERILANGNPNRTRRLSTQIVKSNDLASDVEDGIKKYVEAGFLFILHAKSVEELNALTDSFRSLALHKKIEISNCFGVQLEAYLMGAPINGLGRSLFDKLGGDCIPYHSFDQAAAASLMNHFTDYYTHKDGVPIGHNLFHPGHMPFLFNWFHPSHLGFTGIIAGKTGSGKSAFLKLYMDRSVPLGYRYVVIDTQVRKGTSEGEFCAVTEANGGTVYQISSKGVNILNLFDVQESIEYIKLSATSGYERRTLDLNGAITIMVYLVRILMNKDQKVGEVAMDATLSSDIDEIITRIIKELFSEKGIVHGDADSLYEEGQVFQNGMLTSGIVPKARPTLTEFYKKLLLMRRQNQDSTIDGAYRMIQNGISEFVREVYYTERSLVPLDKEYVLTLPVENGFSIYEEDEEKERVLVQRGIRPYFDGQSTVALNRDCPVTDIDLSMLPNNEIDTARVVATTVVNELFIKKNSEKLEEADNLNVIVDEAGNSLKHEFSRNVFAEVVRTARKRNTGIAFSTQTVVEFDRYKETQDIFSQAAFKMVFKQEPKEIKDVQKMLHITPSQAGIICNVLGSRGQRGEMCVIDGGHVTFVQVDYLRSSEAITVETDVSGIIQLVK